MGFSGTGLGTSGRGVINPFDFSLSPHASLGNIGDTAPKPAADTHGLRSNEAYARLRDVKRILGDAGPETKHPFFFFMPPSGKPVGARAKGLEGFLYSKLEFERDNGEAKTLGQLDDYFR